jgi:hypothetical protein
MTQISIVKIIKNIFASKQDLTPDEELCIRLRLAQNPNTSPEFLQKLASDKSLYYPYKPDQDINSEERYYAWCRASHPIATPPELLKKLASCLSGIRP